MASTSSMQGKGVDGTGTLGLPKFPPIKWRKSSKPDLR